MSVSTYRLRRQSSVINLTAIRLACRSNHLKAAPCYRRRGVRSMTTSWPRGTLRRPLSWRLTLKGTFFWRAPQRMPQGFRII